MQITAEFSGRAIESLYTKLEGVCEDGPAVFAREMNAAGQRLRAKTVVAEAKQSGLRNGTLDRAQQVIPAEPGRLIFTTLVHGGNVRLKYFNAREGGGGVTADPWDESRFYPGAFVTSGRAPGRAPAAQLNLQVYTPLKGGKRPTSYERKGKKISPGTWWRKIQVDRSGLFLPTELTRGETARAFQAGAPLELQDLLTEIVDMLEG
jgi:hypothetical protein